MEYQNYIKDDKPSLLFKRFCFFDTEGYLADNLFIENKVRVHFTGEARNPDYRYFIVFCKVRKKDEKRFIAALEKLKNKMLLKGHTDYERFCVDFVDRARQWKEKCYE